MPISLAVNPPVSEQTIWLVVGFGGLIVLYLLMKPRKRKDPLAGRPNFPLGRQREVEQQMSNLLVELSNMARQITAQLDTRAAKLELLIKEADEKLAELRHATRSDHSSAVISTVASPIREIDSTEMAALSDARPPLNFLSDAGPALAAPPTSDARYADVYSLANEGRSAPEIARLLSRPAGEIELILALRPRS